MDYRDGAGGRVGPVAPLQVEIGVATDSQFYADLTGAIVGVFASTFLLLPNDTEVALVVSIPEGSFAARGIVRFRRTSEDDQLPGLGVAFSKIEEPDLWSAVRFSQHFRAPMFYEES